MPIVLGHREPKWPSPVPFPTTHFHTNLTAGTERYCPGFPNDDGPGYSILIGGNFLRYYNATGTVITSGAWNGGIIQGDITGSPHTYWLKDIYMDATDNKLYFIAGDASTTPRKLKLCTIDKAGTLVQYAWQTLGTGMDWTSGCLQKSADGNLFSICGGLEDASIWARGIKYVWNISNGALTTPPWLPANTYGHHSNANLAFRPCFGPTLNDIYIDIYGIVATYAVNQGGGLGGKIINASTGRGSMQCMLPYSNGRGPEVALDSLYNTVDRGQYWRGYWLPSASSGRTANHIYNISDMNNFVDSVARDQGYL